MYSLGEIRVGHVIEIDNIPFLVTDCNHAKQARGAGVLKTKVKNLITGAVLPKTFQGNEKLTPAVVGYFNAQYLYKDSDGYQFLDNETFEQFILSKDIVGEDNVFLIEGDDYDIKRYEDNPISIQFPIHMEFKIVETTPGVKGDTAQGGTKPAVLENGITVLVPLFVESDSKIKIDTRTRTYIERV
jgi:elongation factor P